MTADEPTLFDVGGFDASAGRSEPSVGRVIPEARVGYVAGVLAYMTWGEGKRSAEQTAKSMAAARRALQELVVADLG